MTRRNACRLTALALALCSLALPLSGCRASPALEQIVYTQLAEETDQEEEMLSPEDEGREDEQFENERREDAQTQRDSTPDQGLLDQEQKGQADHATDVDYSELSQQDWENEGQAEPAGGETPGEPEPEEEAESPGVEPEAAAGAEETHKQVTDAAGRLVDVPENVETVAAVGAGAQMVEMLGGSGRLVAADEAFLSSPLALSAFPDLGRVEIWWGGDGASPLSAAAMERLLEVRPDVCLEFSGQRTFTDAQAAQLEEAGLAYVVLPALSSQANLTQAVSLVGQILGGGAPEIAEQYNAWVERVVGDVAAGTPDEDLTSLYVCGWDESAAYQLDTQGAFDAYGSGLAVAYSPTKPQLVSAFMSAAHIVNESTRIASLHRSMETVYVTPMFHQLNAVVSGSAAAFYSGAGEYGAAYDLFVTRMIGGSTYVQLGCAQFPAVIAADQKTADAIRADWFWQYRPSDSSGYVNINGQSFYRGVNGEYAVLVNPQGMCDWAEGSLESPLEAYWLACQFSGAYTMEQVLRETAQFYETFFHTGLTDAQLAAIYGL